MNIIKEVSFEPINILYKAELENGVHIDVYGDYAIGDDGKTYYRVGYEDGDILQIAGWSCDLNSAVIVEK